MAPGTELLQVYVRKKSYDTICPEHLEYYSIFSLNKILKMADLKIINVSFNKINGGSFAITAKRVHYIENIKI